MENINLTNLTVEELKAIKDEAAAILKTRKAEIKEATKADKEKVKEEAEKNGRKIIANKKIGDKIIVSLKGEEVEVEIVKINEKTVTVTTGEKNFWRYFYQVIG